MRDIVTTAFREQFGGAPSIVVRAPGRVNLIGEHTDYNDGFVMPMAIDRAVWIAAAPAEGREVVAYSLDFEETKAFALDDIRKSGGNWAEYMKGVAWVLGEAGESLRAWRGVVKGDVPIGAGLSSSAALELATARAFAELSGLAWDPVEAAKRCRRAENEWIGVNCGIMDQLISATGRAGHAVLIDCRSLQGEAVPMPEGAVVVVLDTATRRGLSSSAYNERRGQCEAAAAHFGKSVLRDVEEGEFERRAGELGETTRRRARHVISENARTVRAARALREGNAAEVGALMDRSHESLRDDFEVSCPELDAMVEAARAQDACCGARMTGAGFGGCAIALVREDGAPAFVRDVAAAYLAKTSLEPQIYICRATDGAALV